MDGRTERIQVNIEGLAALPGLLLAWYGENARDLPWRRDREPYRILVSEIMLQQTRAEVVKNYYPRFLEALPTLGALARCGEGTLLKLWEGLGYYSRARNLQKAAQKIEFGLGGRFPDTYEGLRELPGVGPYTAGALASICFDLPVPAADGNVLRIMSRIAGFDAPIDLPAAKQSVTDALAAIYPESRRGDFTQSLMELGAVVCLPNGAPKCGACPAAELCFAKRNNAIARLPVKSRKQPRRVEDRTVLLLVCEGRIALRRREGEGLLGGLWELPNVPGALDAQAVLDLAAQWETEPLALTRRFSRAHVFTHIRWEMTCCAVECGARSHSFVWADRGELEREYALPSAFRKLLEGLYD